MAAKVRRKEGDSNTRWGTSLVVQWLRLHTPKAGGLGSVPGLGTRSYMPQRRVHMPQLKIPRATTKTPSSQINESIFKYKMMSCDTGHCFPTNFPSNSERNSCFSQVCPPGTKMKRKNCAPLQPIREGTHRELSCWLPAVSCLYTDQSLSHRH